MARQLGIKWAFQPEHGRIGICLEAYPDFYVRSPDIKNTRERRWGPALRAAATVGLHQIENRFAYPK